MNSVGCTLRSEREAQGRGLTELAQELCITQAYLRAIEADDLKSLPGTFFYKSFVRQYAMLLGLSPEQLRPAVDELTSSFEPPPPQVTSPVRWSESLRVPDPILEAANRLDLSTRRVGLPLAGLVLAIAACSGVYALWSKQTAPPVVSEMPTPVETATITQTVAAPDDNGPSLDVVTTTGADGIRRVALNLSAKEETWLSITSGGKQIFSGTLEPSETKTVEGLDVARMKVGNAGGLEILWNGKPIGPIGESGQVRVVLFTPDEVKILPPAPVEPVSENL